MSRFRHAPPAKPDVAAILKEAIGEFLYRRTRTRLERVSRLDWLGISRSDVDEVMKIANAQLSDNPLDRIAVDGGRVETVGDLIDLVERVLSTDREPQQ